MGLSLTPAVAEGLLNATGLAEALGSASKIVVYSGTPPAAAASSLGSNTVLATLVMSSPPFSGFADTGTVARATMDAITSAVAAATGTATFYRHLDSAGTTVKAQGTVGITGSGADLIVNTAAFTSGSDISISSGHVDLPYGP